MPPRKGPYEAGCREKAGRVSEPRNGYSCGPQDNPQAGQEGKADGFQWPEGNSPKLAQARVGDTTGVYERGM